MIEAILWDNDGVLVDTEHLYLEATRETLGEHGVELSVETFADVSLRQGLGLAHIAQQHGLADALIDEMLRIRERRYLERIESGVSQVSGIAEVLNAVRGLLPMAIVTSSLPVHFDAAHSQHDMLEKFAFVLKSGDYARSKPHPDPYLAGAEKIGIRPGRCLVIEDSVRGVIAARAAGCLCAAVPSALAPNGDYSQAHVQLSGVGDIPALVRTLLRENA